MGNTKGPITQAIAGTGPTRKVSPRVSRTKQPAAPRNSFPVPRCPSSSASRGSDGEHDHGNPPGQRQDWLVVHPGDTVSAASTAGITSTASRACSPRDATGSLLTGRFTCIFGAPSPGSHVMADARRAQMICWFVADDCVDSVWGKPRTGSGGNSPLCRAVPLSCDGPILRILGKSGTRGLRNHPQPRRHRPCGQSSRSQS